MLDLQVVYIRELAEIHDVDFVAMISISDVSTINIVGVEVNGLPANSIVTDISDLLVTLPDGVILEQVNEIRIKKEITDSAGDVQAYFEQVSTKDQLTVNPAIMKIRGSDFSKVVEVWINRIPQKFTLMDESTILSTIPESAAVLETVEVISTARTLNRKSFFSYLLSDKLSTVNGMYKMLGQFIKVLMTTPGTDIFNKKIGGNLQNFVGQNISVSNPQALVAKTVLNIIQTAARVTIKQIAANVPPEERISDVQVLNVGFDESDPSVLALSLKINTFAQQQAIFDLLLGTVQDKIKTLT